MSYLYWLDTRPHHLPHHLPHIHAMYAMHVGIEAVFGIDSREVLHGSLPRRQTRWVQARITSRR